MNKKALKKALVIGGLKTFMWKLFFVLGAITSFRTGYYYSNFFYFLSIPFLLILWMLFHSDFRDYLKYCKNEKFMSNGSHTVFLKNNAKHIVNLLDGKRHGSFIQYYSNGQIKNDFNYLEGKLNGPNFTFYKNGNKYRTLYFNEVGNTEDVKEYFKNGNLKFVLNDNKHTFYDEAKNIKCEVEIECVSRGEGELNYYLFKGSWKSYRKDGTVEYELDFEDPNLKKSKSNEKRNLVMKTVFTKEGAFFSKKAIAYDKIWNCEVNFDDKYATKRMEGESYSELSGMIGPPGIKHRTIDIKPITSIENIIKFK